MEKVTSHTQRERKISPSRSLAVKILNRYDRSDSYIDKLLEYELRTNDLSSLDKSLLTQLVNGTIRWRAKLDWVLTGFFHGEYHKCINFVKNAMRVALYQVMFMDKIPHHASIDESVEIVKKIQGVKAAGLVNGVLRNIARNLDNIRYPNLDEDYSFYLSIIHSHPKWMTKRWMNFWGEEFTVELMKANNEIPTLTLRANLLKAKPEDFRKFFESKNIDFEVDKYNNNIYKIKNFGGAISQTELFKKGFITVQDSSASMIGRLTSAKPGMLVYDLCAAPGGKSFRIAEMMENQGKIIANDKYIGKIKILKDEAERLGITIVDYNQADASEWQPENKADIVLIDAPCSGTGTLRKKPDIKWKRELIDIRKLNEIQKDIINNAVKLVKVGGALVYSTCSIEPEENTMIAEWFLDKFPNFELDNAENYLPKEVCKDSYMQTYPHLHDTDGSFGARFIKKSE